MRFDAPKPRQRFEDLVEAERRRLKAREDRKASRRRRGRDRRKSPVWYTAPADERGHRPH
jgi:hypothetical protein